MSNILVFPQTAAERRQDDDEGVKLADTLRSALDGVGKALADLLISLLADLEDSSLRLSLIIERATAETDRVRLRAEQQDIRATIAQLRKAIDDEARLFARS
jgi:hypothetical protein